MTCIAPDAPHSWRTLKAVDFDKAACAVYRANFPNVPVECGRVEDADLPAADVILAGFPCQPHSFAGERKASEDERDGGDAFLAAIERVRPRMFLGENVAGILSSEGGKYVQRLVSRMESMGYRVEVETLDAVDYGVPQFRSRVWFWGIRNDLRGVVHRWPNPTHMDPSKRGALFGEDHPPWVSCGEALGLGGVDIHRARGASVDRPDHPTSEPCPTIGDGSGGSGGVLRVVGQVSHADEQRPIDTPASTLRSGGNGHDSCCVRVAGVDEYRYSEAMYAKHPPAAPAAPAAPAPTVQAKWYKGGAERLVSDDPIEHTLPTHTIFGEPVKWIRKGDQWMRRLSPRECARLQSVPDDFVWPDAVSKSARYRIIGNGVACGIVVHLSRALAEADPLSCTVVDLFCGGGLWACGWHGRAWRAEREAVSNAV